MRHRERRLARIDSVLKPGPADRATWLIKAEDQDSRDLLAAPGQRLSIVVRLECPVLRLLGSVHPQDVLPPGVRPAQEHARPEAGPDAVADPERRTMAEPLVSQRHQLRRGAPGPRGRWLRDPKYWQGHLRTWAENEKTDGVYPSHVTPKGPSDGQYTDWITSTAWDGHLVHPDDAFLGAGRR